MAKKKKDKKLKKKKKKPVTSLHTSCSPSRSDLLTFGLKSSFLEPVSLLLPFPFPLSVERRSPNDKWTGRIKSVKCNIWRQRNAIDFFFLAWISLLCILSLKPYWSSAVMRFPHSFVSPSVDPFIHRKKACHLGSNGPSLCHPLDLWPALSVRRLLWQITTSLVP